MKAIVIGGYGGPEVMQLRDVPKPSPGEGEVLIKVVATCVNPADWHTMRADPFFVRFVFGMFRPKTTILGTDAAGTIEAVGPGVTGFKPGDEVYADLYYSTPKGLGGFAEYVIAEAVKTAPRPKAWSFEEAASMPMAGLTALDALRLHGPLKPGATVLVNGASGGVGHLAVQLAKAMGAEVTAVTSARNADFVRGLGADHVIDYAREDFTRSGKNWDLVVDAVGNKSVGALRRAIGASGKAAVVGFTGLGRMMGVSMRGGANVKMVQVKGDADKLATFAELADAGKLKPAIEKTYPLAETPAAMTQLEAGHVRGKIAVGVV